MKKLRSVILVTIFATALAGNVFAGPVAGGFYPILDIVVNAVVSVLSVGSGDDNCPLRICTCPTGGCRPQP